MHADKSKRQTVVQSIQSARIILQCYGFNSVNYNLLKVNALNSKKYNITIHNLSTAYNLAKKNWYNLIVFSIFLVKLKSCIYTCMQVLHAARWFWFDMNVS